MAVDGALAPRPAGGLLPRLVSLRWIAVGAQLAVIEIAHNELRMALPLLPLLGVCAALAVCNVLTWLRLKGPWPATDGETFLQLSVDVLALGALLYLTGGPANPFISLLLLPLTIAATSLPSRQAWSMATLTLATYTLLMFHSQPMPQPRVELPLLQKLAGVESTVSTVTQSPAVDHSLHLGHQAATPEGPAPAAAAFALHILGMWFNFLVSGLVVAYFLTRSTAALRERERELATVRENALRHEQILALGTLAAGAAHQLGTPLSTLAVVLREMELEHGPKNADLAADLALARQQVAHCKTTLTRILADAGHQRGEGGKAMPLDAFLLAMLEDWQLLRPGVKLAVDLDGPRPAPALVKDRTLEHALLNLLDNAADASPSGVELKARWTDTHLLMEILDRGPGFDPKAPLGQAFVSTKSETGGMGIGLFLSNATLERFGGKVELFNREDGGACTRVSLPLVSIADNTPLPI